MPTVYFSKLTNSALWKNPKLFWVSLVVTISLAFIVLFAVNLASRISFPEKIEMSKGPEVSPLQVSPYASGKQTYEIVTDRPQSFQIIQVDVDPLDVKQGETQTVTVQVKDAENNPITKENEVKAIVYTDSISTSLSLSLKKAEDSDSATITTWEASWVCQDTYDIIYTMTIKAKSVTKEHSIDLSFR